MQSQHHDDYGHASQDERRKKKWTPSTPVLLALLGVPLALCAALMGVCLLRFASPDVRAVADDEAGKVWKDGDVTVTVLSASVGSVSATSPAGFPLYSTDSLLSVAVEVANRNDARTLTFRGWGRPQEGTLRDDLGKRYVHVNVTTEIGLDAPINGQAGRTDVYSDRPVRDKLVFQRPVPAAKYLVLELPASNVGKRGTIKLKIPREDWMPKQRSD